MKKEIKIILEGEAEKSFKKLNKIVAEQTRKRINNSFEKMLLKSIKDKFEILRTNPFYGNPITKKLIPKNMDVSSLWRIELGGYWRMLYTISGNDIQIVCFILKIINHKEYNKLFGYNN